VWRGRLDFLGSENLDIVTLGTDEFFFARVLEVRVKVARGNAGYKTLLPFVISSSLKSQLALLLVA
jgi:hypothetical protein